jgi:DNA-binding NarL/FixJ family response regulator
MIPGQSIRILLCDDHELVRRGLSSLLAGIPGYEVVAEAHDADSALSAATRVRPDVVLMDVRLPGRSGIEACREIRSALPETRVVMLTSFADDEALFSSIMAGASGYLLKRLRGDELVSSPRRR